MDNFLKYGDLVVLYQGPAGVQTHKRPPSASAMNDPEEEVAMNVTGNQTSLAALPPNGILGPHGGLLSATGYADSGIYMQELIRPWVGDETGRVSEANIIGLGEAVFTITPKLNFDFHKDYKKTLSYFRALESSLSSSQSPEARQEQLKLRDNLFSKLQKLEERTRKEELLNASIVKEATGKPVTYGSDIQLMHFDSASFIKATNDCSQAESIGYMCGLSTFYSSGMVFKVLPRYRSRQDGEAIQLRDNIILQNVKHKAYLTLSKEIAVLLDLENPPDQNPFLANTCVYDTRAKRFHVFLSQDSETSFQVLLYRGHMADSNNYLLGGDMIQMIHTETQGEVTAMISQRGRTDVEVFLRKYQGDYPEEEHSAFSYWFIEHPGFEKAGERFSVKSPSGGRNRTSNGIRLRHMISAKSIEKSVKKAERQEATSVARGEPYTLVIIQFS